MHLEPYVFFEGRCEEAIEFYRKAIGAEVTMLMRFKDSPEPEMCPPGAEEKVMHAVVRVGDATIMVSDGNCGGQSAFQGFALTLSVTEEAEADRLFRALSDGGQVQMDLARTFWSPRFGMVQDRFGVLWMVMVMA